MGLELNLEEIVSLRYGHHKDISGFVEYDTHGMGFQLTGFAKIMLAVNPTGNLWRWISKHLIIEYNIADYEARNSPLDGTKMSNFLVSLF